MLKIVASVCAHLGVASARTFLGPRLRKSAAERVQRATRAETAALPVKRPATRDPAVPATDKPPPAWPVGWMLFGMALGIAIPVTAWWLF